MRGTRCPECGGAFAYGAFQMTLLASVWYPIASIAEFASEVPNLYLKAHFPSRGSEADREWAALPSEHNLAVSRAAGSAQPLAILIEPHDFEGHALDRISPAGGDDSPDHHLTLFPLKGPVKVEEAVLNVVLSKVLWRARVGGGLLDPSTPSQEAHEGEEERSGREQATH